MRSAGTPNSINSMTKDYGRADVNRAVQQSSGAWRIRKPARALSALLETDETVLALDAAAGGRPATGEEFGMGILVLTDRRLLHVDGSGSNTYSLPLAEIRETTRPQTGPKLHTLEAFTLGDSMLFTCFDRKLVDRVHAAVSLRLYPSGATDDRVGEEEAARPESEPESTGRQPTDIATALQTLEQLLAEGLISRAEYDAKRAQILGRL